MIDSLDPNKSRSIQKIKRVRNGNDNSTASQSNEEVTAKDSRKNSAKEERKGSFIDEQV